MNNDTQESVKTTNNNTPYEANKKSTHIKNDN